MSSDRPVDGARHRVKYRDEYLYVGIFPDKRELFLSSVKQDQDPLTGAALDSISRLTTMAWKCNPLDVVINQLRKSSRVSRDLPGILVKLLSELPEEEEVIA